VASNRGLNGTASPAISQNRGVAIRATLVNDMLLIM